MLVLVLVPFHRLRDVAAAGQQASWPEQLLHRRLLDQLQSLPELSGLSPQQLLDEYRALQLMVLYNGSEPEAAAEGLVGAGDKKKGLAEDMEEFLAEQVS